MHQTPVLADFPLHSFEKLRYADTDRQGHVNNAIFSTFLETGRVELLFNRDAPLAPPGAAFVIARLELDFRGEITWPGEIAIGTIVVSVGQSSFRLKQALFQDGLCVALAETVIVLTDEMTHRSRPLPSSTNERLSLLRATARQAPREDTG